METNEVPRNSETRAHAHILSSYQDPHAFGPPACKVERSQTTFLSPDGFVQAPWKPHTEIHRSAARNSDVEETLTPALHFSALDIFTSPILVFSKLTCHL